MAKAPNPGASKRKASTDAAKQVISIRIKDRETTLAIGSVPIAEKLIVRKATGLPLDVFCDLSNLGTDSLQVLFWLGRRANGEAFLTLNQVDAEWPEGLTFDDWDISVLEEEGDDPEA